MECTRQTKGRPQPPKEPLIPCVLHELLLHPHYQPSCGSRPPTPSQS